MEDTQGKFVVVGACSGIGAEIVRQLEGLSRDVVAVCRHGDAAVSRAGSEVLAWDATGSAPLADGLPSALDGLAYCPGSIRLKPFARLSEREFHEDLEINLLGAVRAIRAALPMLQRAEGRASVLLFSTVAVGTGMPYHASIASAKGAVEGLTRALAAELAPTVRVNAIAPSLTDTPLAARLLSSPERRESSARRHPLQRIGNAEEIASLAVSLLAGQISWASGQVFHLDGGLSSLRTG